MLHFRATSKRHWRSTPHRVRLAGAHWRTVQSTLFAQLSNAGKRRRNVADRLLPCDRARYRGLCAGARRPADLRTIVYEQIKNKLVCAYQSLGDRQVKNITDPVSVYRVLPDPAALSQARRQRWPVRLLAVLVIGVIAILGGWYLLLLQKQIANQAPTLAGTQQTPGTPGVTANT